MRFWANLLGYQLVWFCAVIGAGRGLAWPGVATALVFITGHLACSNRRRADVKLGVAALLCGSLLDGTLSWLGWSVYAADAWPAPLWILALWACFALTLNHSLAYLRHHPWLACVFGAVGGPMAYWAAARGWQAVHFEAPAWRATAALALGWGCILPVLATRRAALDTGGSMSPFQQWLTIAVFMVAAMALAWNWQRRHANAGIVDVVWALGMGGSALLIAATGQGAWVPRACLAVMAGVWSLRLASHLWRRVRQAEDGRYHALRERWHGHQGKFFGLFMFQAGLVMLFSLPFLAVGASPVQGVPVALGLAVWLAALTGEVVADRQLDRFRDDPAHRGQTCRDGLWRYSRHPNYFFEWCHWFGYVALAWGSPLAWLSWLGPVLMYVFLRWISGIPFTEQQALRTRGDDYREYQRRTPAFFPWFPKS